MNSKLIIGIISVIAIVLVSGAYVEYSNNTKNTIYFVVDGPAQTGYNQGAGFGQIYVPIHQVGKQNLTYSYVPYINGTAQPGTLCTVPEGVNTSTTFKIQMMDAPDYVTAVDIIASPNGNTNVILQKVHVPVNITYQAPIS